MAVGLQTAIWNNNLRSMIMLAIYPVIIMGIVWACAFVLGGGYQNMNPQGFDVQNVGVNFANNFILAYWPVIITIISIWFIISWFWNTSMIRALSQAQAVTRAEEPGLYNMLENLCIAEGMTMPALNIIETDALNAFASGVNERTYAVTVTRGLMNRLEPDELEAVIGHELTHILNRDVRLLMVTVVFTGMLGLAAQMVWSSIRYGRFYNYGRSNKNKGGGIFVLLTIALILWIGYMATLFMRFAISRRREFMADAGSVQLTKNPSAMMRALAKIAGHDRIPNTTEDIRMMCCENAHAFMGLFATHPPIEDRIRIISEMTATPLPEIYAPPANASVRKNPWRRSN